MEFPKLPLRFARFGHLDMCCPILPREQVGKKPLVLSVVPASEEVCPSPRADSPSHLLAAGQSREESEISPASAGRDLASRTSPPSPPLERSRSLPLSLSIDPEVSQSDLGWTKFANRSTPPEGSPTVSASKRPSSVPISDAQFAEEEELTKAAQTIRNHLANINKNPQAFCTTFKEECKEKTKASFFGYQTVC